MRVLHPAPVVAPTQSSLLQQFGDYATKVATDLPSADLIKESSGRVVRNVEQFETHVSYSHSFANDEIHLSRSLARPDVRKAMAEYMAQRTHIQELIRDLGSKACALTVQCINQQIYDANIGSKEQTRLSKQSKKLIEKLNKEEFLHEMNMQYTQKCRAAARSKKRSSPLRSSRPLRERPSRRSRFVDDEAEEVDDEEAEAEASDDSAEL